MNAGRKTAKIHPTGETLAKAAGGDQSAFTDLVHQYQAMVFSLAYHFLHDGASAEELSQEVFLQLYQSLPKIESPSHLQFWLRRVTSHRCIDWARRNNHRSGVSLNEVAEPAAPEPRGDPVLARKLRRLVATLPEKSRMIVTLRFQEDLQPTEIAEILEMPVNTVKSHLHRALELLHQKLTALENSLV
jgi:RNA polymerase sigma-70 factor (ECF subfamily)